MKDWSWRDWKDWVWLIGVSGVLLIIVITLGPGLAWVERWFFKDPATLSGWVQAIGSIAAILGAFAISASAQRKEREKRSEQQREETAKKFWLFKARLENLDGMLLRTLEDIETSQRPVWALSKLYLAQNIARLEAIQPGDMPTPAAPSILGNILVPLHALQVNLAIAADLAELTDAKRQSLALAFYKALRLVRSAQDWILGELDKLCTDEEVAKYQRDMRTAHAGLDPVKGPPETPADLSKPEPIPPNDAPAAKGELPQLIKQRDQGEASAA